MAWGPISIGGSVSGYTLPAATGSVLGGVKTGKNITNTNGTISLSEENVTAALGYTPPTADSMTAATTSAAGKAGLVPAPAKGAATRYLCSDGTWRVPPDTNTTYSNMTAATASAAGKAGLVPAPAAGEQAQFLRGDGTWATPANTTYSAMKGATASAAGAAGLVPAPAAGKQAQFLRGDGTWAAPTNATQSAPGLMSAADKTKLDGIAAGATGSNISASGTNYVRFSDGTQICWGITAKIDNYGGASKANFPVPFVNADYGISVIRIINSTGTTLDAPPYICPSVGSGAQKTYCSINYSNPGDRYLAIGRWK